MAECGTYCRRWRYRGCLSRRHIASRCPAGPSLRPDIVFAVRGAMAGDFSPHPWRHGGLRTLDAQLRRTEGRWPNGGRLGSAIARPSHGTRETRPDISASRRVFICKPLPEGGSCGPDRSMEPYRFDDSSPEFAHLDVVYRWTCAGRWWRSMESGSVSVIVCGTL